MRLKRHGASGVNRLKFFRFLAGSLRLRTANKSVKSEKKKESRKKRRNQEREERKGSGGNPPPGDF